MAEDFNPDEFLAGNAPPSKPAEKSGFNPDEFLASTPAPAKEPEMPGILEAGAQGLGSGIRGVAHTAKTVTNSTSPMAEEAPSPAAEPFEMKDLTSPFSRGAPKIAYRLAEGAPTLATGVAGGLAGAAVAGPPGAIAGGAAGAALGSVAQSLGPIFGDELKRFPGNPEAAWDSAMKLAAANGLFAAAGWAAFPAGGAAGPLKQAIFQAFGVQPAISMAHKATTNVMTDRPAAEGVLGAGVEGSVMTAVPALGHGAIRAMTPAAQTPNPNMTGPRKAVADRLENGDGPEQARTLNDAYTNMKDDLHPIKVIENAMAELSQSPQQAGGWMPYMLARLTRGSSGKAVSFIDFDTFDYHTGQRTGESLRQTLSPVKKNIDEFEAYLTAKRAVELEGRGIDTGVPLADAQQVVNMDRARFEPTARRLHDYQDRLLDYMKESGLLNQEQVDNMRQANRDYVPFYRIMDEGKSGPNSPGGGVYNPVKAIQGSERKIVNPIESIIKNTHLMIDLAEQNRARRALVEMAENTPGSDTLGIERVKSPVVPIELSAAEKDRLLSNSLIGHNNPPAGMITAPADFSIFRPKAMNPSPDEIAIYRDGKREVWKVPPEVARATEGMSAPEVGTLLKIASYPAKVLRAGVTLAPDFFVKNMVRDQLSAFAFSKNGYIPLYDFMKGMRQIMGANYDAWLKSRGGSNAALDAIAGVLGRGEDFKEWMRSGGANAALVSGERDYVASEIRRLADSGSFKGLKGLITNPLNALQATSELFESATRVGDFARARKGGKDLPTSGYESREVTLDFWRVGAKVRAINSLIAFFNANMEGLDRAGRAFKERPFATSAKVASSLLVPSMLLAWANRGDKRLDELPAWERDFFWHIPTDKWTAIDSGSANGLPDHIKKKVGDQWYRNDGTIWKIPKNFELGLLFGSVPERMFDKYYKDKPDAWYQVGKSFQRAFMLEPSNFIPTGASPALEQAANYSFFTERSLVPESMSGRNRVIASQQFTPFTTEAAKLTGKGLGKIFGDTSFASPIVIENYVRAWTGSLGVQALRAADEVLKNTGAVKVAKPPTPTMADTFFMRGFASRYPSANAESIQHFYETYNERSAVDNTMRFLAKKVGDPTGAAEVLAENASVKGQQYYTALNNMNAAVRNIYRDPKMSPEDKRNRIDNLYLQMIEIAKAGNTLFRSTKKDAPKKAAETYPWEATP